MEHDQAQSLLSEYVEQTLRADAVEQLEAHLATCDECRQTVGLLRQALSAVRGLPRVQAPPHFARLVRRRARQVGLLASRRRRLTRRMSAPLHTNLPMAFLLAAVGALIGFVLIVQQQIELLTELPPTVRLEVQGTHDISGAADITWRLGGRVKSAGRWLSTAEPLGERAEVELALPPERWTAFTRALREQRLGVEMPKRPPQPTSDGMIHLVLQAAPAPTPKAHER